MSKTTILENDQFSTIEQFKLGELSIAKASIFIFLETPIFWIYVVLLTLLFYGLATLSFLSSLVILFLAPLCAMLSLNTITKAHSSKFPVSLPNYFTIVTFFTITLIFIGGQMVIQYLDPEKPWNQPKDTIFDYLSTFFFFIYFASIYVISSGEIFSNQQTSFWASIKHSFSINTGTSLKEKIVEIIVMNIVIVIILLGFVFIGLICSDFITNTFHIITTFQFRTEIAPNMFYEYQVNYVRNFFMMIGLMVILIYLTMYLYLMCWRDVQQTHQFTPQLQK